MPAYRYIPRPLRCRMLNAPEERYGPCAVCGADGSGNGGYGGIGEYIIEAYSRNYLNTVQVLSCGLQSCITTAKRRARKALREQLAQVAAEETK